MTSAELNEMVPYDLANLALTLVWAGADKQRLDEVVTTLENRVGVWNAVDMLQAIGL